MPQSQLPRQPGAYYDATAAHDVLVDGEPNPDHISLGVARDRRWARGLGLFDWHGSPTDEVDLAVGCKAYLMVHEALLKPPWRNGVAFYDTGEQRLLPDRTKFANRLYEGLDSVGPVRHVD